MKEMSWLWVIHRDIKNANILLHFKNSSSHQVKYGYGSLREGEVEAKLADFGFSTIIGPNELTRTQCGTPLNMAPEILNGNFYDYKVDIWSLGVSMFEALLGTPPFYGRDRKELT